MNPRISLGLQEAKVGSTLMNAPTRGRTTGRIPDQRNQLGRQSAKDSLRKARVALQTIPHDLPRASSSTNDNYFVDKLQEGLLAGSQPTAQEQTIDNYVNFHVAKVVHSAPGHSQKRELSPRLAACYSLKDCKLKSVKSVSCVTQLSCVKPVTNVKTAPQNLPVGARLQNYWQTWLDLGAGPKVVQILKEGYTLPFWIRPNLTR